MGVFDSIGSSIKSSFQRRADKKREEREFEEKLRRENALQERIEYEREYKRQALQAAKLRARMDASKKTGLAKLRALSRIENLDKPKPAFLQRLSEYTQGNLKRREENLKRTKMLRSVARESEIERKNRSKFRSQYIKRSRFGP